MNQRLIYREQNGVVMLRRAPYSSLQVRISLSICLIKGQGRELVSDIMQNVSLWELVGLGSEGDEGKDYSSSLNWTAQINTRLALYITTEQGRNLVRLRHCTRLADGR